MLIWRCAAPRRCRPCANSRRATPGLSGGRLFHQFQPQVPPARWCWPSRTAIHTWPESRLGDAGYFACNYSGDNRPRPSSCMSVLKRFQPQREQLQRIQRGGKRCCLRRSGATAGAADWRGRSCWHRGSRAYQRIDVYDSQHSAGCFRLDGVLMSSTEADEFSLSPKRWCIRHC